MRETVLIETTALDRWSGLIVDGRMPHRYLAGHIPGAVSLPTVAARQGGVPNALVADPEVFAELAGQAGIDRDTPVVVYGERGQPEAGFVVWALVYYGHPNVRLLDGGLENWQRAGGTLSADPVEPAQKTFVAHPDPNMRATLDWLLARRQQADVRLLDNRSAEEFSGEDALARNGGHIPDARWLPWESMLNDNLTFKDNHALKAVFAQAGLEPDQTAVVYCQTGNRSSLVYTGLRLIGHPHVRMYDGSWSQWGNRLDLPVEGGFNAR